MRNNILASAKGIWDVLVDDQMCNKNYCKFETRSTPGNCKEPVGSISNWTKLWFRGFEQREVLPFVFKILPRVPLVYYTYSCQEPNVILGFLQHEPESHVHRNFQKYLAAPVQMLLKLWNRKITNASHTVTLFEALDVDAKKSNETSAPTRRPRSSEFSAAAWILSRHAIIFAICSPSTDTWDSTYDVLWNVSIYFKS